MDKKYQIFISSTYSDLVETRRAVSRIVLRATEIPAAMEDFGSIDANALDHIKQVIDRCDYYILIIAGRYGSCDEFGVGYTEREFDYAVEKGKFVLAYIKRRIDDLPMNKVDSSDDLRDKLERFKLKVADAGKRLITYWNDEAELLAAVGVDLGNAFRSHPAIGWVRADALSSESLLEAKMRISRLEVELEEAKYRNSILRSEVEEIKHQRDLNQYDAISLYKVHCIKITVDERFKSRFQVIELSWIEIFQILAPIVKRWVHLDDIRYKFSQIMISELNISTKVMANVRIDNAELRAIESYFLGLKMLIARGEDQIYLTDIGDNILNYLRMISTREKPV